MKHTYYKLLILITVLLVGVQSPANTVYQTENFMELQVPFHHNIKTNNCISDIYVPSNDGYIGRKNTCNNISILSIIDRKKHLRKSTLMYSDYMYTGSNYSSNVQPINNNTNSGPRRVGGHDYDPDPFMGEPTPIGDFPISLLVFIIIFYVMYKQKHDIKQVKFKK